MTLSTQPTASSPRRRPTAGAAGARATAVTVAVAAAVAVGGALPAQAARHAPCPTGGTTLVRGVYGGENLRLYRTGATLAVCVRTPGERRVRRTLGPWTRTTRVAVGGGSVAWTTARDGAAGRVDAVATIDVRTGRRWLRSLHAVPATGPSVPATDDRVLRIDTNGLATVWVTAGGAIGTAVVAVDDAPLSDPGLEASTLYGDGAPSRPYRAGRVFALGTAGAEAAPAVARGVRFFEGGDSDSCGGLITRSVEIPAFGTRRETSFVSSSFDVEPSPGC
ncbi:unannotated protein [freshwater metagenome]|uniref:Unannotated protein n=1 Tax=freshwater metagenome TaxID=449393 RepID=A0A6J7I120_9ZZZZ|nr:hypothetical protein [Actinomycetota bacterium]